MTVALEDLSPEDPIKDGLNWYAYAGNNPVMFFDPSGFKIYIPKNQVAILEQLSYLTRDELGIDSNGYLKIVSYNDDISLKPVGTDLISQLINSERTCTIKSGDLNRTDITDENAASQYRESTIFAVVMIIGGDIMKKKFLIIMLCILSKVLCINLVSLIFPINRIGIIKKAEKCREMGIISNVSNDYVTRTEFLESFLKCVGMSEDILDKMISITPYVPVIDDYINPYPYYSSGDKEKVEKAKEMNRYNGLCKAIVYLDAMQAYEIKPDRYEYRGSDYITLNEAVSMIEACLTDFETDSGRFDKNSREYRMLLLTSRIDGILLPCDALYWSFTDTKLTQTDMVMLLYRLSNRKRYKYISDEKSNNFPIDENRIMTYYEYLTMNK